MAAPPGFLARAEARYSNNVLGIAYMVVSVIFLAAVDTVVKIVARDAAAPIHPVEIVFFRNLFGLVALAPYFLRTGLGGFKTERLGFHALRGAVHSVGMISWFWALTLTTLADATALSFMMPIFATMGAILFMGEPSRRNRWLAIAISFVGMLIILRPGVGAITAGSALVLLSAVGAASSKLLMKSLSRTDSVPAILFYLTFFLTIFSFVPSVFVWTWPTPQSLALLFLIGIFGILGHLFMTWSFRLGDVTAVEPAYFTRLIFAAIIGYVFFTEAPPIWTYVGSAVIVLGSAWLVRSEAREARRALLTTQKPL